MGIVSWRRWLRAAALAQGKDRLDFLTMHVAEARHGINLCGCSSAGAYMSEA